MSSKQHCVTTEHVWIWLTGFVSSENSNANPVLYWKVYNVHQENSSWAFTNAAALDNKYLLQILCFIAHFTKLPNLDLLH